MRYFHRTSLAPDEVMAEADKYFGSHLLRTSSESRARSYEGAVGKISVTVQVEGGHYTRVTVETDQVGESDADKLAKRFLVVVHARVDTAHEVRGAY